MFQTHVSLLLMDTSDCVFQTDTWLECITGRHRVCITVLRIPVSLINIVYRSCIADRNLTHVFQTDTVCCYLRNV